MLLSFLFFGLGSGTASHAQVELEAAAERGELSGEAEALSYGSLENGLLYVIISRRSAAFEDEARVSIRMRVEGGWQAEGPGENGLNHLIEHLARGGNGQMSPAEVIRFRDQDTIVRDWGAFTSPYTTEYFLTTRSNEVESIESALRYFDGIARGLQILPQLVAQERQVVINEMAGRLPEANRLYQRAQALAPGSEWDISRGYDSSDVASASLETIRGLYQRVYRPENVTFLIVGDVKPSDIEKLLRVKFGEWTPSQRHTELADARLAQEGIVTVPSLRDRTGGTLLNPMQFSVAPMAPGRPAVLAGFRMRLPYNQNKSSALSRARAAMLHKVISAILSHRLELAALEAGFSGATFAVDATTPNMSTFLWQAAPNSKDWTATLAVLLDEIEAARKGAFTQRELTIAKQLVLRGLHEQLEYAPFNANSRVSASMSMAITRGFELQSETIRLNNAKSFVEGIALKQLNENWQRGVRDTSLLVRIEGIAGSLHSDPAMELASFVDSYVAKPPQVANASLVSFGTSEGNDGHGRPGAVVEDNILTGGVRSLTFSNGSTLRLINREHDGPYLEISVAANDPVSRARLTACDLQTLPAFVRAGGAGKQSEREIRDALWGKGIRRLPFEITSSGLRAGASARIEDTTFAIRELHTYFADPEFNEAGSQVALGRAQGRLKTSDRNPASAMLWAYEEALQTDAVGLDGVSQSSCTGLGNMQRAALLLGPILKHGQIDVAIAGNMDEDEMISLFASTFGQSQPKRETFRRPEVAIHPVPELSLDLLPDPGGQQTVGIIWALNEVHDGRELAKQNLLTALFARMVYIKLAEQGTNYAPRVERLKLKSRFGQSVLVSAATTPKAKAFDVLAAIQSVAEDLTERGPDPELLEVVRALSIDGDLRSYNEDRVWSFLAAQITLHPDIILNWRSSVAETQALSADEIQELARATFSQPIATTGPVEPAQ